MKSVTARLAAPLVLLALLGGCDKLKGAKKAPGGQVVATVQGDEITLTELQAELGAGLPSDPTAAKAVQSAVLQRIIARDVLAKAAHDQKLDQSPQFAMQMLRARKQLMGQMLQQKIAADVPPPEREDAERFVSDHPTMFSQRAIFMVEQIQAPPVRDEAVLKELSPLKTFEDVEAHLDTHGMQHERTMTVIDGMRTDPKLMDTIDKLPAGELFIVPTQGSMSINQVKEKRTAPFTGEPAVRYAMQLLRNQRAQEAVAKQERAIVAAAQDKIKYNDAYKPPAGAKVAAPAPAAPASDAPDVK